MNAGKVGPKVVACSGRGLFRSRLHLLLRGRLLQLGDLLGGNFDRLGSVVGLPLGRLLRLGVAVGVTVGVPIGGFVRLGVAVSAFLCLSVTVGGLFRLGVAVGGFLRLGLTVGGLFRLGVTVGGLFRLGLNNGGFFGLAVASGLDFFGSNLFNFFGGNFLSGFDSDFLGSFLFSNDRGLLSGGPVEEKIKNILINH
jgi:hypothetical protein